MHFVDKFQILLVLINMKILYETSPYTENVYLDLRGGGGSLYYCMGCPTLWSLHRPFLEILRKK